ncbi:MAG: glycosyltransferase, partial [Ilumatobacteraceae bacterium]
MTRPRACIVRQGPTEPTLQREWRALTSAGFDVDVICERARGRPWREELDGVRVYRLPITRGRSSAMRYVFDYAAFFVLATVLLTLLHVRRRYRFVQVSTMPDILVFAALPAKLTGARVVGFFKEPTPDLGLVVTGSPRIERVLRRIELRSVAFCHHALTVTEDLRQHYIDRGVDGSKLRVVLNCTEERWAQPPPRPTGDRDQFAIFMHGSVEPRYGHETVLRALAELREMVPAATFTFCGKGNHVDAVLRTIDELGLRDRVRYLGFLDADELTKEIEQADVGIVAQLSSPYSNVVHTVKMFDYMDAGLPIVASRLSATFAAFGPDDIAYFEPGDPRSLSDTLLRLHTDRDELARRGRAARALHEQ